MKAPKKEKKSGARPWMGADGFSFHEYQERVRQQQAQPQPPGPAPAQGPTPSLFEVFYGREAAAAAAASVPVPRPAAPARPTFEKRPRVDPNQFFDVAGLWEHVRGLLRDPAFRPPAPLARISGPITDPLASALETAAYFQLDPTRVRLSVEPWRDILDPFLIDLMGALNSTKPADVPGTIRFERAPDSSFWMVYV